jgi:hypothetical protein
VTSHAVQSQTVAVLIVSAALRTAKSQEQELEHAFAQVCEDEKLILADQNATEAQSVYAELNYAYFEAHK